MQMITEMVALILVDNNKVLPRDSYNLKLLIITKRNPYKVSMVPDKWEIKAMKN